jgi:ATP-binding protein involved in chromosome partitioning
MMSLATYLETVKSWSIFVLSQVKKIIAVASGKGGVGKSTTAVNLALALQQGGQRVGLLDADIYGPSIAMMLGVAENTRPQAVDEKYFQPIQAHGLATMSMAYLVTDKTPMAWRGPMAAGALQQLLQQTAWGELDVLVVDMPPGTGDIQLTLAQKAQVAGAIIVTTPQDIALLDARKGIEMFLKVNIPVLGVVENMAVHICSQCGHGEHIFGDGGGAKVAADYGTKLLGSLPLDLAIRQQGDCGVPAVSALKDHAIAQQYRDIGNLVMTELAAMDSDTGPEIVFE